MSTQSESGAVAITKGLSAWAAVGITSWSDVAAFLASIYTLALLGEWIWKHGLRDFCVSRGWIAAKKPNK